ncbi:MAG: 3-deoxy-7-phosphoheptulonate synthase [Clostridia bacterium]
MIKVGKVMIGGANTVIMAGPCAVESDEQIDSIASHIKTIGANILRGGAFKPRTSPNSFQGLEAVGLRMLQTVGNRYGMPIISEITRIDQLDLFLETVDIIQVGARNMQNFELLKELSKINKPVMIKRGFSSKLTELLSSVDYVLNGGNDKIILCERGIRTFETYTRNTLDISAVPALKELMKFNIPIIVDPSHACGKSSLVESLAKACVAVGADGIMIEVHPNPMEALSDGEESLNYEQFKHLIASIRPIANISGKPLGNFGF